MRTLDEEFEFGLSVEARVIRRFKDLGYAVSPSTAEQDRYEDIDFFADGMGVSIKRQQDGLKYGHIYAELWEGMLPTFTERHGITDTFGKVLTKVGTRWILVYKRPSWLDRGNAERYAIVQGNELIILEKSVFVSLIQDTLESGRARIKELSEPKRIRAFEEGHPALTNKCIYLPREKVKRHAILVTELTPSPKLRKAV